MKKPLLTFLFLLFILFLHQSCKKTDFNSYVSDNIANENFFRLPDSTDKEIQLVANNLKKEFNNKAVDNFLNWHGQPLWNKAIVFKTNEQNFIAYIPTKKPDTKKLQTFFIVQCSKGKFYYEMHTRSAVNYGVAEPTKFSYTQRDIAKMLAYMDYKVLNIKDTLFLNNALDGIYANRKAVGNNKESLSSLLAPQVCLDIPVEVPCTGGGGSGGQNMMENKDNAHVDPCYEIHHVCMDAPTGGGDGPIGGGGGSTGGGGGNDPDPPPPSPCPQNLWYSLVADPNPCNPIPSPQVLEFNPCDTVNKYAQATNFQALLALLKAQVPSRAENLYIFKNLFSPTDPVFYAHGKDNEFEVNPPSDNYYVNSWGWFHNHFADADSAGLIFSAGDLNMIAEQLVRDTSFFKMNYKHAMFGVVADSNAHYILMVEDINQFKSWATNLFINENVIRSAYVGEKLNQDYLPLSVAETEKRFLKVIQNAGLKLFRGSTDFNSWTPIKLNSGGIKVISAPCE